MARAYIITYDLKNAEKEDYDKMNGKIEAYNSVYISTTTYTIVTTDTARTIRDNLKKHPKLDKLLVIEISKGDWSSYGLSSEASNWLHKYV